jgi:hypothetical protein
MSEEEIERQEAWKRFRELDKELDNHQWEEPDKPENENQQLKPHPKEKNMG